MKLNTDKSHVIRFVVAVALALGIWSQVSQTSAEHAEGRMMEGKMMEHCKAMKAAKEKMGADIKAQDAELNEQITKMNKAPQPEKLEIIATILTRMAEQRSAMNARKAKMEEGMMKHMMEHMQMGKESMSECPMMKGMKHSEEKSEGDHKEHHDESK